MPALRPIVITTGDPLGIGAEVISKGLNKLKKKIEFDSVFVFGKSDSYAPFKKLLPKKWRIWSAQELNPGCLPQKNSFNLIDVGTSSVCGKAIELAALGCLNKTFSAMVTGPIDKNDLLNEGYTHNGHTEMLQHLTKSGPVTMLLAGKNMRVALVTTHIPLSKVSGSLTQERLLRTVRNTREGLNTLYGLKNPRLAVLGLNPHSSDGGLYGNEESTILIPAIEKLKQEKFRISGPYSPDGFFALWKTSHSKTTDAIICLYHDQGLIPLKLLDFDSAVNVTLGLPIIRTSVDHGTARDIAGKNIANPNSFCAALLLAQSAVKNASKRVQK